MRVAVCDEFFRQVREIFGNVAEVRDAHAEDDAFCAYDFAIIESEDETFGVAFKVGDEFFFELRDEAVSEFDAIIAEGFDVYGSLIIGIRDVVFSAVLLQRKLILGFV